MAQFRGVMQGRKGLVSRLGSKRSGLSAKLNGWNMGVKVELDYDDEKKQDRASIYLTSGSNGKKNPIFLASISQDGIVNLQDNISFKKDMIAKIDKETAKSKERRSKSTVKITSNSIKFK